MGDAILGDVTLALVELVELVALVGQSDRPPPEPRPEPGEPPHADPLSGSEAMAALAAAWPADGIAVVETPSSIVALRNRLRLSRPGSYFFGAAADSALASPPQSACSWPSRRAAGGVRAGRRLGAVRDHRPADRGRPAAAGDLPGAGKPGVLDPEVVRGPGAGHRGAGPEPARARRGRRGARVWGASRDVVGPEELTAALRQDIAAQDGPRLVQVRVAPGMWLE